MRSESTGKLDVLKASRDLAESVGMYLAVL